MKNNQTLVSLKSAEPSERIEAIENFLNTDLTGEEIDALIPLISDPDKGVRNALARLLSGASNPRVPRLLVKYVQYPELSVRNLAGEILLNLKENATGALLSFIDEGDDDDKKFVIDLLGLIGDLSVDSKIIEVLNTTGNQNLILSCIEALGNLKSEQAVQDMIGFYEKDETFKPNIIEALGKINSKSSLEFLTGKYSLENDLDKVTIIESLGQIGDVETFFFLLSELNENSGPIVWILINSIYQLKEKLNLDIPFDERMRNSILYTITEGELKYKKNAANLLSDFNDREILNACFEIYGLDEEIDEILTPKFFANYELIFDNISEVISKNPSNLKSIIYLFKEILFSNVGIGLNFFDSVELRNLSDALIKCLKDSDEEIRITSFEILNILDQQTAILFMDIMADDTSYWNRLKLLEILSFGNDENTIEIIKRFCEDEEEMVRERAVSLLNDRMITP